MTIPKIVTTDYLKSLTQPDSEPVIVRKDSEMVIESDEADTRQLRFVVSTGTVDRDNDVVSVDGWDLTSYQRNPIVLFAHDTQTLPIGKVVQIGVEGNALKATIQFVPADVPEIGPHAEAIYQLCKTGFLSAVSVGFFPTAYELSDRMSLSGKPGLDISGALLCEISLVPLPSNPDAMIEARSLAAALLKQKTFVAQNIKARRIRRLLAITA